METTGTAAAMTTGNPPGAAAQAGARLQTGSFAGRHVSNAGDFSPRQIQVTGATGVGVLPPPRQHVREIRVVPSVPVEPGRFAPTELPRRGTPTVGPGDKSGAITTIGSTTGPPTSRQPQTSEPAPKSPPAPAPSLQPVPPRLLGCLDLSFLFGSSSVEESHEFPLEY